VSLIVRLELEVRLTSISARSGSHEHQSENPKFPVCSVSFDSSPSDLVGNSITSIPLDSLNDPSSLFLRQELVLLWEFNNNEPRDDT
jgi:hypothetical protein